MEKGLGLFKRRRLFWAAFLVLAAGWALTRAGKSILPSHTAESGPPPNIVLLLTDDQRWDQLQHMPIVRSELGSKGVSFANAFVSNPLCCPARATILTGLSSGHNGVWSNNRVDAGGFKAFRDLGAEDRTIATVLHDSGYYTGLVGKYMNGYAAEEAAWVPPGWNFWRAMTRPSYYGPSFSVQGKSVTFRRRRYQTDVLGQQALRFIESAPSTQPLFLFWAPHAPHRPADPAPGDEGTLAQSLPLWRPASYNEADVSGKPWFIQAVPPWDESKSAYWDAVQVAMHESLLSVDRWIGRILSALEAAGRLHNTLLVFTSDNGFLLGEHRWQGKLVPYEESIRVPWIVRWDSANFPSVGGTDAHLIVDTDVAPTFAKVAGVSMEPTDGLDFVALLQGEVASWRSDFLIEHGGEVGDNGAEGLAYCGVRTETSKYVQYWNGFEELYQLSSDPNELENLASDPNHQGLLGRLRERARSLCDPPPPGFTWQH